MSVLLLLRGDDLSAPKPHACLPRVCIVCFLEKQPVYTRRRVWRW
jgi:hypothetical protein